jgi:cytochrome c oxidase assembly protein subunit 15
MKQNNAYLKYTWFVLIMVFLVILAGGVVRMTQSGMGCPDWPRCFGRWVPPISESQLPADYEKYLRTQDIDHSFNAYHTWIEYINRLLGALLGIFILVHTIWSFKKFRKTRRSIVWLSFFMLIAVGFQGYLGKMVVDANLSVVKVTAHMLVALLIAALPVWILARLREHQVEGGRFLKIFSSIALLLVLVQIVLGTEVREQIDEISKSLGYAGRELWIDRLNYMFLIHRSLSWLVGICCFWLFWRSAKFAELKVFRWLILIPVLISILAGLSMNYLQVPAIAQPIHLLSASALVIGLFSFRLQLK